MASYLTDLSNKMGLSSTPSTTTGGKRRKGGTSFGNMMGYHLGGKKRRKGGTSFGNMGYTTFRGGKKRRKTKRKRGGSMDVLAQASVPFGMIGLQRMVGKNMSRNQSKRRNRSFGRS
jgi:hypothetical protein